MTDAKFRAFKRKAYCDEWELFDLTEEQMNTIANGDVYVNSPWQRYYDNRMLKKQKQLA